MQHQQIINIFGYIGTAMYTLMLIPQIYKVWKNKEAHGNKENNRGFLAQDVKNVDDRWIEEIEVNKGNLDFDIIPDNISLTSKLGEKDAMYISVIQQLIARIETLENA